MPTPPVIPQDWLIIVSALTTFISHFLRDANLSKKQNFIISIAAIVIITTATLWITTGFTGDIKADVVLACGIVIGLFADGKEFGDLLDFLYMMRSPVRRGPSPIPPRASREK